MTYKIDFKYALLLLTINTILLFVTFNIFSSVGSTSSVATILAAISITAVNWLVEPFLKLLAKIFGIVGILIVGIFGNALVVWLTLKLIPGISIEGFWSAFGISWAYSLFITIFDWAFISRSNELLLSEAIRNARKHTAEKSDKTGFIFVQLDGVSKPVLEWQLRAGNLPNISRLLNEEDYTINQWKVNLPSTTPASQAGILLGSNDNIPAFRWYEKESNKLVVANQNKGASTIEKRLSTGKGLLFDGGISMGNLFSGDAEKSIMVISKFDSGGRSLKELRNYSNYFATPYGFMRSIILSIGEMFKEMYQARRQKSKDIKPRVHRGGAYVFLRAGTNVLLRDLQTTIIIDQMMRGVNSMYADFLDYDEVAHHAGVARPESLASLTGLDDVLGLLFEAKKYAPRPYEIIALSDHGQSQGPTYKQINNGVPLQDLVTKLMDEEYKSKVTDIESVSTNKKDDIDIENDSPIVFTGSGNLGNIWFKHSSKRLNYEDIIKKYPKLIKGMLKSDGGGILTMCTESGEYITISEHGSINLKTGKVKNLNPLDSYPELDIEDLYRLASMKTAPDISIISEYNAITGEVHAFEELVGNHGGSGGWQTEAFILHPKKLDIPRKYLQNGQINGAASVHEVLVSWMKKSGQR